MMATTTTKCEETLVDWLRDAHAMEKQAEQMRSAMIAVIGEIEP